MKKLEEISQRLVRGQKKLEEIKKQYDVDSKKITELIQKRANLLADEAIEPNSQKKAEIKKVNEELENLKRSTEGKPELLNAIGEKLKSIQTEKSSEELRLSFEKQKKVGQKIIEKSGELLKNLGLANQANTELRKLWSEYRQLHTLSKKSVFKEGDVTSQGSAQGGMLESLTSLLKWEIENRKPRPCIEVGRIRY